jgi:DNA-binding NarL/FixJ family response regulator
MCLKEEAMRRIRVQIADPADLARQGLRGLLCDEEDMELTAPCKTVEEAVIRSVLLSPDIVLLGYGFSRPDRLEAVRGIIKRRPGLPILVLTDRPDVDEFVAALKAGAQGYLGGDIGGSGLLQAIRVVGSGGSVVDHHVTRDLFAYVSALPRTDAPARSTDGSLSRLTPREREVLRLMAQGHGNKEIGVLLGISVGTAKTHVRHIFRKLQVSDRTRAVLIALDIDPRQALAVA